MRILQYVPYSYHVHSGGVEKISQTLSDWFNQKENTTCWNIASDIEKKWKNIKTSDTMFIPSFYLVYNFPLPKLWHPTFRKQFWMIKTYNPDIIVTHTRFFVQSFLGWLIAKYVWCKRVHIEHWSWFLTGYPWYIKMFARLFDRSIWLWIFKKSDKIVTISKMHTNFIKKFTSKDVKVIYNPIEYVPKKRLINKRPHIWFVGRLTSLKWVDLLIQSLKQIEDIDRECTIVWDGNQRIYLEEMTNTLWLESRVQFVWAQDRSVRLHTFDVFVNPSHQEGLPTTVVEALIAWCAVIATDVWWTKEISAEKDLILIPADNITVLTQELKRVLQTYVTLQWISKNQVLEKFDVSNAITSYLKIYE